MLKYFEISFKDNIALTKKSQHVQFNFFEKIKKLKNIKPQRINLIFDLNKNEEFEIIDSNGKVCNIHSSIFIDHNLNFTELLSVQTYNCLSNLFIKNNWDVTELDKVFSQLKKENFNSLIPYFKKKWTKNKSFYGELVINYQPDFAEFLFISGNNNIIIYQKSVLKARLNPMLFKRFLFDSRWDGDNYIIMDELDEIRFLINPIKKTFSIEFNPIENTENELKSYLRALDYGISDKLSNDLFKM